MTTNTKRFKVYLLEQFGLEGLCAIQFGPSLFDGGDYTDTRLRVVFELTEEQATNLMTEHDEFKVFEWAWDYHMDKYIPSKHLYRVLSILFYSMSTSLDKRGDRATLTADHETLTRVLPYLLNA